MLHNLGWQSLDSRRQDQRLVLFYKIINTNNRLASVETEDILMPADSLTRKNHSLTLVVLNIWDCSSPHSWIFENPFYNLFFLNYIAQLLIYQFPSIKLHIKQNNIVQQSLQTYQNTFHETFWKMSRRSGYTREPHYKG